MKTTTVVTVAACAFASFTSAHAALPDLAAMAHMGQPETPGSASLLAKRYKVSILPFRASPVSILGPH